MGRSYASKCSIDPVGRFSVIADRYRCTSFNGVGGGGGGGTGATGDGSFEERAPPGVGKLANAECINVVVIVT